MRAFRRISDDRWLARLDNRNPQPEESAHIAEVAAEYVIPAADIQLIETAVDLRDNPLFPPAPVPTPSEVELGNIRTLYRACLNDTATAAQVRTLVGLLARRLLN